MCGFANSFSLKQAVFFSVWDWHHQEDYPLYLEEGPSGDMFGDLLQKMGGFLSPSNVCAEGNLGGAPPEFLPQMLLEENPVRLSPSSNSAKIGCFQLAASVRQPILIVGLSGCQIS